MPMPARTLKTFLRFMLEALHTRDQSPCDLPGHLQCLHELELTGKFRNGLRRRWWAGICTSPRRRRARRRHTGWRCIVLPKGTSLRAHDRGPWVAGVANGIVVQVFKLVSAKQRVGHTSTCVTE